MKNILNLSKVIWYPVFPLLIGVLLCIFSVSAFSGVIPSGTKSLSPILKNVLPSVVNLSISSKVAIDKNDLLFNDPIFRNFFEGLENFIPQSRETKSIGSGVIIDGDKGYIVTNYHVVNNADEILVTLQDKRTLNAKTIGSDKETDIAVLKVNSSKLSSFKLGNAEALEVGDFVVAIGNPMGLNHTVTSGIISALGRKNLGLGGIEDFIQTDASINPGNSGGALINLEGELIGINALIATSRSGGSSGIGFAIPINIVKSVYEQIVRDGRVSRGIIGVLIQDLTPEVKKEMGVSEMLASGGVLLSSVVKNGPADKAGLAAEDIIVSVDGHQIESVSMLKSMVSLKDVGAKIRVRFLRNKRYQEVDVKIDKALNDSQTYSDMDISLLQGVSISNIPSSHPLYRDVKGVFVTSVAKGSVAWSLGLREGYIITSVNKKNVANVQEFKDIVNKKDYRVLLLNVRYESGSAFIVLQNR
ncbi:Do family serine endopeptidase [Rickettsia endosymbiont of Cardiosporidium cionae]|uniref:Do family serine endopeptidase n=1 Tax=Rickettsia endosymbiont of Cardiosporidium cionae TaxID=2777155 RepID=UPI00189594FB|nr:Do family serine endopeptidase [Rickettsia endosymbiont of Cardiosporidium cionae]KAF8818696.1 PDZ domain-containing protein [Rickettsia endosymbiont of Cardiosporidium cionae]